MEAPLEASFVNSFGRTLKLATPADLKSIWRQVGLTRKVDVAVDEPGLAEIRGEDYRELLWNATPAMLQVMDSGMPRKCAIAYEQFENGKDSREAGIWSVIATEDIKTGEPIGVYTGILEVVTEAEEALVDADSLDHLFYYELPSLPSGKGVVINGLRACNEMRLLQDPIWTGQTDVATTNVIPKPVWHPPRGIPFIVFTAERPIKKGDELLISYGEAAWEAITRTQLFRLAETAHQWHVRVTRLEAHIGDIWPEYREELARESNLSDNFDHKPAVTLLVPSELRLKKRKEPPGGLDEVEEAKPVSSTEGFRDPMRPLPKTEWERREGFMLIRKMYCSDEVRKSLERVKLEPAETFCWPRLRQLVLDEGKINKCAIKEIVALSHPARFATPPHKTCYALVAEKKLLKGEPIGLYLGSLRPDRDDFTDEYSYSIMKSQLRGYQGPDLQLSANNLGNETRFINDWWNREGGRKNINCEAHLVMWDGLPHLLVCTTRTIHPGDEIVTSYGTDFWKPFSVSHMRTLANYNDAMSHRCNKLVELFAEMPGGEKLNPNEPVQTGDIFQADTLDYGWMPESPSFLPHAAQKKPRCGKDSTPSKRTNSEGKR